MESRTLLSVSPIGTELPLNDPSYGAVAPDVAAGPGRSFVGVWTGSNLGSGDVYAQRYDTSGSRAGGPFLVNTRTDRGQSGASVAMDAQGDFVVVWESEGQDGPWQPTPGDHVGIAGQRFNALGVPQGQEFRINTTAAGAQVRPDVATDASGNFVATWLSPGGVYFRRFDASGTPLAGEVRVNVVPDDTLEAAHVAAAPDGSFVVSWLQVLADGTSRTGGSVWAQRFDAAGAPRGGPILVESRSDLPLYHTDVGADAFGGFVVAWDGEDADGQGSGIRSGVFARRYATSGDPVGPAVTLDVNNADVGGVMLGGVAVSRSGEFAVVYAGSGGQSFDFGDIYARWFDASGAPLDAGRVRVNGLNQSVQREPAVSVGPDGTYTFAWETDPYQQGPDAVAQQYAPVANPATVRGFVWADLNQNNLRDPGEPPIDGVLVSLFADEGSPFTDTGIQAGSVLTAGGGQYRFDNLRPGDSYFIVFTAPPSHAFARADQGADDSIDSDANPSTGRTDLFPAPDAAAGGVVSRDAGLLPPGSIEGMAWNDANADGVRQPDETRRDGVAVEASNRGARRTTVTHDGGTYRFDDVTPGTWTVRFVAPAGLALTTPDQGGDDTLDGDADPKTGSTPPFQVRPLQNVRSVDAGIGPRTTVSGTVFRDMNEDGVFNSGDVPAALSQAGGPVVFADDNDNGLRDPGEAWTTSSDTGQYSIQVTPGTHRFTAEPMPYGWTVTMPAEARTVSVGLGESKAGVNLAYLPPGPRVSGIFVGGTRWSPEFKRALAAERVGDAVYGLTVPERGPSFALPWAGMNEITLRFSRPVDLNESSLSVGGVNVARYPVTGYRYDAGTHTATWTLAFPMNVDRVTFALDPGAGAVGAGGAFPAIELYPMRGNADRNGLINIRDFIEERLRLGATTGRPSAGRAPYYYYYDIDADGRIGATDMAATWSNLGRKLPPNPAPASLPPPASPQETATSALSVPSVAEDLLR